jgi:hypothetical protein
MNTLTPDQFGDLAKEAKLNLATVGFYASKKQLFEVANTAFAKGIALGVAQGIQQEKDRINSAIPQYFAELERPSIKAESTAIRARK